VADAAGVDFDEDFTGLGEGKGDVFDEPGGAGFVEDDGAVGFGEGGGHCLVCVGVGQSDR